MTRTSRFAVRTLCTALALLCSSSARAEGKPAPAAIAPGAEAEVQHAFDQFARQWMKKIEHNAIPAPNGGRREYADYRIELRATGQTSAPYVGLLRYTENLVECKAAAQCATTAAIPVTEIFRFERGHWVY